jgi:serine/threonine-protein kinase
MPETRFGPYVLLRRIAVGGMAEVYLARFADGPPDAHVVVKQILPQLAEEPELLQLFIDEARIASRVVHPSIVRVLDVGVEGGVHFLAMEYVEGLDGSQLMRLLRELHGQFSVGAALRIIADVCRGLHHAHEATEPDGTPLEIVHRDVSPQNVLISRTGQVKLTDFGIARARIRARRTATGVLRGKIAYVSPEQYLGDRGDRRVDVYAAGVVLFEMLAGRRPFTGDEANVIREVMTKDSPPLSSVLPGIDPRVSQVIARALAREPDRRYSSAAELADAIEDLGLAASRDTVSKLATEALLYRDKTKQASENKSSPPKPKATMTLAPPPLPAQPKKTETLEVPLPPMADTLLLPAAVDRDDEEDDEEDEGDTVFADHPPITEHRLRKRPSVAWVLGSVIAFGFAAGWIYTWFTPVEDPPQLSGARIDVLTATSAEEEFVEVQEGEEVTEDDEIIEIEDVMIGPGEPEEKKPTRKKIIKRKRRPQKVAEANDPAQPQGFGELSLDTDPWSYVRLGKRELGVTPLAHVRLPAGRHRLVLENKEKGITRTIILSIKADQQQAMRVRLSDGQIVNR